MKPSRTLHFEAELTANADITKLWERISHYKRVNLGGRDSKYIVYFNGALDDGLEVMREVLATDDDVNLKANTSWM